MQFRLWPHGGIAWNALIDADLFRYTGGRSGRFFGITFKWLQFGITLYRKEG